MTPEQIGSIILNLAAGIAVVWAWWTRKMDRMETRRYTDADQTRRRDQDREERLLHRISELEDAQAVRESAMQADIANLRVRLEECEQKHAHAQVTAAGLQAENAAMQRQLDVLMRNLDRRQYDNGPPRGQPERRTAR